MPNEYLKSEGEFLAEASKPQGGWLGRSKEKQTPYIQVNFTVVDDVEESGKEIAWFGYLSDKAIERTIDTLVQCFGFDGDLNSLHAGKSSFDGMRARISCEAEEYEGKRRVKVKWLNPVDYERPPSISDDEAKMLIAGLGKKVAQAAVKSRTERAANAAPMAKAAAKPTPKPAKETAPVVAGPEDDVPF